MTLTVTPEQGKKGLKMWQAMRRNPAAVASLPSWQIWTHCSAGSPELQFLPVPWSGELDPFREPGWSSDLVMLKVTYM